MTDYIGITEAQSNPFAPLTSELVKQLRDNPIAIAEGAEGAPRVQGSAIVEKLVVDFTVVTAAEIITLTNLPPLHTFATLITDASILVDAAFSVDNGSSFSSYLEVMLEDTGTSILRKTPVSVGIVYVAGGNDDENFAPMSSGPVNAVRFRRRGVNPDFPVGTRIRIYVLSSGEVGL